MFLPFLLYLVAMTAATLAAVRPEAGAAVDLWRASLAFVLPWVVAWLLGLISERWLGSRAAMRIGRRRWLALATWLATVSATPMAAGVMSLIGTGRLATEAGLAVLLLHFWITDSLALQPPHLLGSEGPQAPARGFLQALRVPTPFLVLVLMGLAISTGTQWLLERGGPDAENPLWWSIVVPTLFYVLCAAVAMPVLLRVCWGLGRLEHRDAERAIVDELRANGVRGISVLAWPEALTGYATAGVIGIVPGFRYLLFSETLAVALTEEEVRSVTAHEAAHLKHRHLWFYFAAVLAAVLLIQVIWQAVFLAGLWFGVQLPMWAVAVVELSALLVFLRMGWGFLSRHFERQADGHALRRGGLAPFQSAIAKVALINGIAVDQTNWHHHGIGERVTYLQQAQQSDPALLKRHDRTVRRLKLLCVALLAVAIGAQWLIEATPFAERIGERYWERRLAAANGAPVLADLPSLQELAMLAYRRKDLTRAEHYYRQILALTPEDPQTQNNLAWLLVTRPNAAADSVHEGLALAQKASAADHSAYILDTLAEAYVRANQPEHAREAAQEALHLAEAGKGRGEASLRYYRERLERVAALRGALLTPRGQGHLT